jgi:hypothetical protein
VNLRELKSRCVACSTEEQEPQWVHRFADELRFLNERHGGDDRKTLAALRDGEYARGPK